MQVTAKKSDSNGVEPAVVTTARLMSPGLVKASPLHPAYLSPVVSESGGVPQSSLMNGSAAGSESSSSASSSAQSTAKFLQNPAVKLARMAMSVIDRVSPTLAARITFNLISTPPSYRPKPAEKVLMASAHKWKIPFQGGWLQCYRWGQGPLCLFVHCWGGRGAQPETMIRQLTESGFCVVSFDHPAHGQSSGKTAEMIRMSAAVAAVVSEVGPIDTLIGHSLGVAATAIALRDHALPVRRLVSISSLTHCVWFTEVIRDYLGISTSTMLRARAIVDKSYAQPVGWEQLSVVDMLASLTIPILLIHDCDDQEIPFDHAMKISRAIPQAQFLATTGLGHRRLLKDKNVIDLVKEFSQQELVAS